MSFLEGLTKRRSEIGSGQPIGDIGGEEADLVAAIIGRAREFERPEVLLGEQPDHRIGDLDLAARTRRLLLDLGEDLGLKDIAARR